MSNWKELEEIPDSEDEIGFDSQNSRGAGIQPVTFIANPSTPLRTKDVWDFLDSDEERERTGQAVKLPNTSPKIGAIDLSSLTSTPSDDTTVDTVDSRTIHNTKATEAISNNPIHDPNFAHDNISPLFVHTTSSIAPQTNISDGPGQQLTPQLFEQQGPEYEGREAEYHEDEQAARQTAFRTERSLRPRKPIQEHPYLLENAQYSSFLKVHGIKPIRMAMEAERRRREAVSQDDEFDQSTQEDGFPERASMSPASDLADVFTGNDELQFLPSSPPQLSSIKNRTANHTMTSSQNETDNTSIWDQELPDLEYLLNQQWRHRKMKSTRQKTPQPQSTSQKSRKRYVVHSDPHEPSMEDEVLSNTMSPLGWPARKRQRDRSFIIPIDIAQATATLSPLANPAYSPQPVSVADVLSEDDGQREDSTLANDEIIEASNNSEGGEEMVTKFSRRIRGVLPASWLRLDQQLGRDRAQGNLNKRQQHQSPEYEVRRGVAQPRRASSRPTTTQLFSDDSEDELMTSNVEATPNEPIYNQSKLQFTPLVDLASLTEESSDGEGSVLEEDHIDRMAPKKKKRPSRPKDAYDGSSKRAKTLHGPKRKPKIIRQTKIDGFQFTKNVDSTRVQSQKYPHATNIRENNGNINRTSTKMRSKPPWSSPQLSILDIIEPKAPKFLKIAARTAKRRMAQGRSSPNKKSIRLATRQDNVDAVSVLERWKLGFIKQRPSVSTDVQLIQRQARPLKMMSGNHSMAGKKLVSHSNSRKFVKRITNGGSIAFFPHDSYTKSILNRSASSTATSRYIGRRARPAQLELDEKDKASVLAFHSKKKLLDRIFRKQKQGASTTGSAKDAHTESCTSSSLDSPSNQPSTEGVDISDIKDQQPHTSRFRKKTKPARVDTLAPQYIHAGDPLTTDVFPSDVVDHSSNASRLQGLGPYGTQYTHHFEVFPLDSGVFFHDSTLIGAGILQNCVADDLPMKVFHARPRAVYNLNDQVFRWGQWNDQVSSELGIVLDLIAEQLENNSNDDRSDKSTAVTAATFVLNYVKDSLSIEDGSSVVSLLARLYEVFLRLVHRVRPWFSQTLNHHGTNWSALLGTFDRLTLTAYLGLRIARSQPLLVNEQFQMEELLKSTSASILTILLSLGVDKVKATYNSLSSSNYRYRGLRDDAIAVHSWTLLMKILGYASIPKVSFWDMLRSATILPDLLTSVDARKYEQTWETLFVLLPLVEFSDTGIIVAGKRHSTLHDGWTIPQRLLRRLFQLYEQNDRQAPSFNSYCRALVARCHYLVDQWGWYRSGPVIGTIFDFFGAQNFAHLRNEEVYQSPQFLEELSKHPSLNVEINDRCFHIFLKLLALSIQKLTATGFEKDVRNLVARTIPNHNRQYLKEQNVLERDLAALRNHHDLIGTLFWASPAKLRPAVTLIERLVTPENSHKEACLINIRAWSQLARFIVASGEATTSFKPFNQWRSAFFQRTMAQYELVPADIHQQFLALSTDISKSVSQDMVNAMISINKTAIMEVLYLCIQASLEVMKHAPDLEAATFCLSTSQLQQVFKCCSTSAPELDWPILKAALAILDAFLIKVDEFQENEESQQTESQMLDSAQADDALVVVDRDLSRSFFRMVRGILCAKDEDLKLSASATLEKAKCAEQASILSARMSMKFITGGIMSLSHIFKSGKYGLFDGPPHDLELEQRKYLVLFLSTLLEKGLDDFLGVNFTLCEVWMLSIVKPRRYVQYENALAVQLRNHGKDFVPDAVVGLSIRPDYHSNRDLFEFAVSWMRKSVRSAGPSLERFLGAEHAKALKRVMEQIRLDLKVMADKSTSEHRDYVMFVRDIISLIKAQGSDICQIDNFFYHISKEYSPPSQDPQLQVAGMISCGLRLQEGNSGAGHQLFYLLFNNFKFAMANNKLQDDVDMLIKGMKHRSVLEFILGKMLPAIIRTAFVNSSAFPVMDVYVEALHLLLEDKIAPRELGPRDIPHVAMILRAIVDGMSEMSHSGTTMICAQVHVMAQTVSMMNILWPSLFALSVEFGNSSDWTDIDALLDCIQAFAISARAYLQDLVDMKHSSMDSGLLLEGWMHSRTQPFKVDGFINSFTGEIVNDIAKNWVIGLTRISIQTPIKPTGDSVKSQGLEVPTWEAENMVLGLHECVQEWCWWWERYSGKHTDRQRPENEFCFY